MRSFRLLVTALACGFAGGAVLKYLIAIAGRLLCEGDMPLPRGLNFLPVISSILCAVTVMVWQPRQEEMK
ncbi:DUF5957 family protein [Paenibacillus ihbetae]|uniref:Uncharacterized protein n=1 Tax=Paenibacillus ihbetae TaxID=1870820 RepID=A0ABX3K0N5_9BACL|nr:DUF5957 family protein [Paenibacillus ihbetae]OOC63008.1 hypothetical protein BBD40_14715 [Paenibacillus ihbetae]